ncbi:rodlin [Streptomyces sp. NPDC059740]|uniref:rodlin n=1 Tax=Streptomyces sp. NPDC059740 TaxID=3346926 RepID=UPI0036521678
MKKFMAGATIAASLVGLSAAVAPQAFATANDHGPTAVNGNGSGEAIGNAATRGHRSPQFNVAQGLLNKPCVGVPVKANVGSLIGLINVAVQDIDVLSNPQFQQCTDNSTQQKRDEPLSHILDDIPVLSANGAGNR